MASKLTKHWSHRELHRLLEQHEAVLYASGHWQAAGAALFGSAEAAARLPVYWERAGGVYVDLSTLPEPAVVAEGEGAGGAPAGPGA